jgi:murein DD-endopeptidase MepM/ murein hydrolase activator NlpD
VLVENAAAALSYNRDAYAVLIDSAGKRLVRAPFFDYFTAPGNYVVRAAILAVPSTVKAGTVRIRVEGQVASREQAIVVQSRDFVSEELALSPSNASLITETDPEKTRQAEEYWAILNAYNNDVYTASPFRPPVQSTRRTSFFGTRRVYRYPSGNTSNAFHYGIDYGVPLGTPVSAAARGVVQLARLRIVTGNTVIIEHMPGVYSLYFHMNGLNVRPGDIVEPGDLIGWVGSTGFTTGPHLHFEIRVAGIDTDPDALMSRSLLDTNYILSTISY